MFRDSNCAKNHLVLLKACASLWENGEKFSLDLIGIEGRLHRYFAKFSKR